MPRGRRSSGALVSEMASTSSRTGAAGVGGESLTGPPGWAHPTARRLVSRGSRAASRTRIGRGAPAQRRGQRAVLIAATTGHPSGVARADGARHGVRRQGRTAHHARQAVGRRPGAVGRRPRIRCACPRGEAGALLRPHEDVAFNPEILRDFLQSLPQDTVSARRPGVRTATRAVRAWIERNCTPPDPACRGSVAQQLRDARVVRDPAACRRPAVVFEIPSKVSVPSSAITCTPSSHCGNRCEAIASESSGR